MGVLHVLPRLEDVPVFLGGWISAFLQARNRELAATDDCSAKQRNDGIAINDRGVQQAS
jgi:hypothetical protein